jgi:hypothetical protein
VCEGEIDSGLLELWAEKSCVGIYLDVLVQRGKENRWCHLPHGNEADDRKRSTLENNGFHPSAIVGEKMPHQRLANRVKATLRNSAAKLEIIALFLCIHVLLILPTLE